MRLRDFQTDLRDDAADRIPERSRDSGSQSRGITINRFWTLNLGCGRVRRAAIGIDSVPNRAVDILGDASSLDFIRSNSIDFIIAHHFVEHVIDQDRLFRTLYRVLKPEGVLWIRVPYKLVGAFIPFHYHIYDEKSFNEFCNEDPLSLSLQFEPRFRIVGKRVNRKVLVERRVDILYHMRKRLPRFTRWFLHVIAVTEDIDRRERSKIGFKDEIECLMQKVS